MGTWMRALTTSLAMLMAAAAGFFGAAYLAARQEPEFYHLVVAENPPEVLHEAAKELEQRVAEMQEAVKEPGDWQTIFTQEQINGWLATQMPREYPRALPTMLSDPRVMIDGNRAWLACRYKDDQFDSVLSVLVDVALTDEPNQLSVRLLKARIGALPIPVARVTERLTLERSKVPARLTEIDGQPAVLVTIPEKHPGYGERTVYLEEVELRDGQVVLAGFAED